MKFTTLGLLSMACLETSFARKPDPGANQNGKSRGKPAKTRFGFPMPSELLLPKPTHESRNFVLPNGKSFNPSEHTFLAKKNNAKNEKIDQKAKRNGKNRGKHVKTRFGFPMPSGLLLPKSTPQVTPGNMPVPSEFKRSLEIRTPENPNFVLPNGKSFNPSEHTFLAKRIDDQIEKIEILQPRRAHRPANPEKESMLKKNARNGMETSIPDSSFIKSDSTIRLKNDDSTCFGGVSKSKKGSIVVHGDCEVLNATQWSYEATTGQIKNQELDLCVAVNLAGKSWRQVALLRTCDPYDSRQSWNYENEHLSLRISSNACLGVNGTVSSGPVTSFDCMENEISLPSFPEHEFGVDGKCARKQGNGWMPEQEIWMENCSTKPTTPTGRERYPRVHLMYFRQLWEFKNQSSLNTPSQTATQQILQQIDLSELQQIQEGVEEKQNYCWQVEEPEVSRSRVKLAYCSTAESGLESLGSQQFDFDPVSGQMRSRKFPEFCLGRQTGGGSGPMFLAWCFENKF